MIRRDPRIAWQPCDRDRSVGQIRHHMRARRAPAGGARNGEVEVSARFFLRRVLLVAGLAVGSVHAMPALAQALGDADCPGGYYFDPAYRVCVPYGYAYVPDYDAYTYAPPFYGPTYLFLSRPHDHDTGHRRGERRRRDDDRYSR